MNVAAALKGVFVTGTDTGVGKTLMSAALLYVLKNNGLHVAGLKPVAAGMSLIEGAWKNEDVDMLHRASSVTATPAEIGPYQLQAACSPHIAAALEGRRIDPAALLEAAHVLNHRGDGLVVEGVGGLRVPLGPDWDSADLACVLGLPVILVVGVRLGCLNHALLTVDVCRMRGLALAGWVANVIDPGMTYLEENLQTLRQWLLPVPCLGVIPWQAQPEVSSVARYLDQPALCRLFQPA